jgi:signal transduction histidine kinase
LREANATKDKFFSIIAHDLKNPLHSMIGFSDLLENQFDEITDEKKKRYIQNINLASKNLFKLLVNLLEWARLQTGSIEFDPAQFDLNTLIEDVLDQFKVQTDQKEILLSSTMEDSTMVFADYNMVDAVVRNLLSNAIKFTPNGGEISVSKVENTDHWEIAVKDTGVGIDLEDQEKLFDLSSKYSTFGTNNEMGTGLGLGLCKEFVERCGGQIWVSSEKNGGSIFRFTLSSI